MPTPNRTPEQAARDNIDTMLSQAGWAVQDNKKIDFSAAPGIAVREYPTDAGPADYALFVDRSPVGVVEAKPETWGQKITTVEEQSGRYAAASLKWVDNSVPLPFVYESTGALTRFTDARDPKPRSREVFSFPKPGTMRAWLNQPASLRTRLKQLPALDPTGLRKCQINAIQNLEKSFKNDRPRALIQMATGSGKTYTAITSIYRLLKHADAKRILFLVDTRNLGEQAEQEFMGPRPQRRQPQVHRALQRPAPAIVPRRKRQPGLHQHYPAHVLPAQGPGDGRGRRGHQSRRVGAAEGADAGRLQRQDSARVLRLHRHRRMPPVDLQRVAPSAGILRRLSHRADGHAGQPHLRVLQEERRQRIHPRGGRRRRRQRRQRGLRDRHGTHEARRPSSRPSNRSRSASG